MPRRPSPTLPATGGRSSVATPPQAIVNDAGRCLACGVGVSHALVCARCASQLAVPTGMASEQLVSAGPPSSALLVDPWGRPHPLRAHALIGRDPRADVRIVHGTISRHHATIVHRDGGWWLHDLGSANGTWRRDHRVAVPTRLSPGDRLRFCGVGCYFAELDRTIGGVSDFEHDTAPVAKLPAPLGGPGELGLVVAASGGGLLSSGPATAAWLSPLQVALVRELAQRWRDTADRAIADRGFIRLDELTAALPVTARASPAGMRQLIRRLRVVLADAGAPARIEVRPRRGYRLVPRGA